MSSSNVDRSNNKSRRSVSGGGIYVSLKTMVLVAVSLCCLFTLQTKTLFNQYKASIFQPWTTTSTSSQQEVGVNSITHLRSSPNNENQEQCRFYLAESAIPRGGLGIFTGVGLHKDDMVGFPDICIFVADAPKKWTHLRSHTFGGGSYFGQYEGSNSRAACEGFATNFNTMPDHMVNTEIVSPVLATNAGLSRSTQPGAGSITHYFGIHAQAKDIITAGSELIIYYGDWDFDETKEYTKPQRSVKFLEKNGYCIDNIRIDQSTIREAGRGAFARRFLQTNQVVSPAPLQCFQNRSVFQKTNPEQLYVNYCIQPQDSDMIFYPYGAGVNLINHDSKNPNVFLRWSKSSLHHSSWLDLSYHEFWKVTRPGGLILEVVANRDIQPGEELFMDYGRDWEDAWKQHTENWQPPLGAEEYVYPADMDETTPLRTVKEQKSNPYPDNIYTMCHTPDIDREERNHQFWEEQTDWPWAENTVWCHILERYMGDNGDYVYDVSLSLDWSPTDFSFNESIPFKDLFIDKNVPRRAIRFMEKPYMDDEHLPGAFRHPIVMPDHLVPEAWKNV